MRRKLGEYLGYGLHVITFITYFILLFTSEISQSLQWLQYPGFVFFILGLVFLAFSFINQHQNKNGAIIDKGVYGIIRHPMYLGAILLFIAMGCFIPVWLMLILAIINIVIVYLFILAEEKIDLEKYGNDYREYMASIPQVNFIIGLIRKLKTRRH